MIRAKLTRCTGKQVDLIISLTSGSLLDSTFIPLLTFRWVASTLRGR